MVVKEKIRYGVDYVSKKYKVPLATIFSWSQKHKYKESLDDKRSSNGRPFDQTLDNTLMQYFLGLREKNLPVTAFMIQTKAKELKGENFNASNGWMEKFMRRNKIVQRKKTHQM